MKTFTGMLAFAAIVVAAPVAAHPKVVSSTPAEGATAAKLAAVAVRFNEKIAPAFSGAKLFMTGMAGMTHAPMQVDTAKPAFDADGKGMTIKPAKPLTPGDYRLDWFTVGADTHRVTGSILFKVS